MKEIKFYEVFEEEQKAICKFLDKSIKALFTDKTIQEEEEPLPPAKIISIRTQSRIPPVWGDKLEGILSRSQGFDHLVAYQKETRTKASLGFLSGYCSRSVAEHAIMAMMVLMKKLKQQISQFSSFERNGITGHAIEKKKALIIGVGKIGYQIACIAKGLGMDVKGVDIDPRHKDIEYASLLEGIAWADVIFSALPLTEKTHGLLNYQVLKNSDKKSILINISRGEISPVVDLERLLNEKILGGIALDVFEDEKNLAHYLRAGEKEELPQAQKKQISAFLRLEKQANVLLTPHNAFNTQEALEEKASLSAKSIETFLKTGEFPFPVNV